jgi:hypothetical protein
MIHWLKAGLEINLDVIPVIMTDGSLNLPVTAEFMLVIVTPLLASFFLSSFA